MHIEQTRNLIEPYYKVIEQNVNIVCEKLQPVIVQVQPYYQEYVVKNVSFDNVVITAYAYIYSVFVLNRFRKMF